MKKLLLVLLLVPSLALAAKTPVEWVRPQLNTDGTPLTDLAGYRLEWGDCAAKTFPFSAGATASQTGYTIVSSGIAKLCIRIFAINKQGVESPPSNTLQKSVTTLGKPQTLGQPVPLP